MSRFFEEYAGKTDIEIAGLVSIDQIGQVALVTKDKKAFFSLENTKFQGIEDQDEIISIISSLSPEEFLGVAVLDKE